MAPVKKHQQSAKPFVNRSVVCVLCLLLPALLGGCPEFRNGSVNAIDTATRSVLLGDTTTDDALDAGTRGVFNAALDLFFEQFLAEESR